MYLMQYTALLFILLHQCIVSGFNNFNIDMGFNSIDSSLEPDESTLPGWFVQKLDHFNTTDEREFKVRYYKKLTFWKEKGPIYILLGGASYAKPPWKRIKLMYQLANETNGAMYIAEHRYYGESKPFNKTNSENLKYLSSQQILFDIAKFIQHLKSLSKYRNSKVVIIGCFYGGNLATWTKALFPNLVDAAISSGGPALAKKDFYECLEKVNDDYKDYGGPECLDEIKEIFKKYDSLLQTPEGIKQLKKDENICEECDMTLPENQSFFFMFKIYLFIFTSQRADPDLIKYHCDNLKDKNYYRFFLKENYSIIKNFGDDDCLSYDFNAVINYLKTSYMVNDIYAWMYQTCTEFGYFRTTNSRNQPFSKLPLEYYIKICTAIIGDNFNEKMVDEGVENSNKLYGGLHPNVTRVIFTNGAMDPWSKLSIVEDLSHDAPAFVLPESGHCKVIYSKGVDENLIKVRNHVKSLIKNWIGAGEKFN